MRDSRKTPILKSLFSQGTPKEAPVGGLTALTLAGTTIAVAAALVAKKRSQIPQINGHAVKFTPQGHKQDDPLYVLVSGQLDNHDFADSLNSWLDRFGSKTTLFGYCAAVKQAPNSKQANIDAMVETALSKHPVTARKMALELSEVIIEGSKHSSQVIVHSHQGTEKLAALAVKLLPANVQSKVKLLPLAATLQ